MPKKSEVLVICWKGKIEYFADERGSNLSRENNIFTAFLLKKTVATTQCLFLKISRLSMRISFAVIFKLVTGTSIFKATW